MGGARAGEKESEKAECSIRETEEKRNERKEKG